MIGRGDPCGSCGATNGAGLDVAGGSIVSTLTRGAGGIRGRNRPFVGGRSPSTDGRKQCGGRVADHDLAGDGAGSHLRRSSSRTDPPRRAPDGRVRSRKRSNTPLWTPTCIFSVVAPAGRLHAADVLSNSRRMPACRVGRPAGMFGAIEERAAARRRRTSGGIHRSHKPPRADGAKIALTISETSSAPSLPRRSRRSSTRSSPSRGGLCERWIPPEVRRRRAAVVLRWPEHAGRAAHAAAGMRRELRRMSHVGRPGRHVRGHRRTAATRRRRT